jgi:hypothetical protein
MKPARFPPRGVRDLATGTGACRGTASCFVGCTAGIRRLAEADARAARLCERVRHGATLGPDLRVEGENQMRRPRPWTDHEAK